MTERMTVDYKKYVCGRARVEDVEYDEGTWYAVVCSWFGQEKACTRVNITALVERLVREEAERILRERCAGDEECMEDYWDLALEEATERIAEGKLLEIVVQDHANEIVEEACPDLLDALAPRH